MSYKMEIIEDQDEGGFVISYPDLPGCITCGENDRECNAECKRCKKRVDQSSIGRGNRNL